MTQSSVRATFPLQAFQFSGQSSLETWTLTDFINENGWRKYDQFLSHEPVLCLERVRQLADNFPTYQHRAHTGRPPVDERTHIIAMLTKQFFRATFRELEGLLHVLAGFFRIEHVPDHNTMSEKNRTPRFRHLLNRFHAFLLDTLEPRKAVISTDATGYSNTKRAWSTTDYGLRATQDWIKVHAAVEIPSLLYLNTVNTPGRVHESQVFEAVWSDLPSTITPIRSLADAAYAGEHCLTTAKQHGATPLHAIRKDARHARWPKTAYQKLVNFATHWPNRFAALTARRKLVETTFNCTKGRFGHQLRCRHPIARENEIMAKQIGHNVRMTVLRDVLASP